MRPWQMARRKKRYGDTVRIRKIGRLSVSDYTEDAWVPTTWSKALLKLLNRR